MLVLRHNTLSSDKLITCERTMLKFLDGKLEERTGMEFKVWDWSIPELYGIVLGMMVKLNLAGTLNISKSEMLDFIIDVEKGYCDTSYHSFYHAVDVVEILYYMLTNLDASKYLTALDSICLLIAGLCHDIGHPGLNNVYQVNARTELAKKYDDQSVLENYSCTLTLDLITKHKLFRCVHIDDEYLSCDPKEIENSLRNLIVKIILATDMTFHFDLLESLHNMIEVTTTSSLSSSPSPYSSSSSSSAEESGEEMDNSSSASSPRSSPENSPISLTPSKRFPIKMNNNNGNDNNNGNCNVKIILPRPSSIIISLDLEQRELLLKVLIHAADLSNTVRPWDISKRWSDLIVEEFFNQGDLEKTNNLPVSPNMDRKQSHQCQISLGFGDFVVKPYFEAFASFLHQASIFLDVLADNRVLWDQMKNDPSKHTSSTQTTTTTAVAAAAKAISTKTTTTTTNININININTTKTTSSSLIKGKRKQLRQLEFKQEGLLQEELLNVQQGQQRRVSLAAGLLIIPDDIQEKLRSMSSQRSPRYRKLKRSLSGRSYSHHSLLPTRNDLLDDDDDDEDDDRVIINNGILFHESNSTITSSSITTSSSSSSSSSNGSINSRKSKSGGSGGGGGGSNGGNLENLVMTPIITFNNNDNNNNMSSLTNTNNNNDTISSTTNNCSPSSSSNSPKKSTNNHHKLRLGGRVRRSSSLDHNMIRQITALYGNGDSSPTEQRIIVAGS
ncbi:hypothetical protein Glove_292g69 [Diversispora epigaea]|uniref:Phosphodiesterase n=1 Tax=Diversispora epigaea TaxID=1348612 RepID=A0A397I6U0_9GLOM|nr:hypothetical protein Glove_292g69 [Diversispora epigaea]